MRANKQIRFSDVPLYAEFYLNGNTYVKQSTRTGWLVQYARVFYFSQKEIVLVL